VGGTVTSGIGAAILGAPHLFPSGKEGGTGGQQEGDTEKVNMAGFLADLSRELTIQPRTPPCPRACCTMLSGYPATLISGRSTLEARST